MHKLSFWGQIKYYLIELSRRCEIIENIPIYRKCRALIWPLAMVVMAYECPQSDFRVNNRTDYSIYVLDLMVCVVILLDSLIRLAGFYIRYQIEVVFHRKINLIAIIHSSGILDTIVAILCLKTGISYPGLWLRLIRNMIASRVFFDVFPPLEVLLSCLSSGFQNVYYVFILFFTVIIVYGHIGYFLFRHNDPFHFGSILMSMLQFFCLTTLENWSTVTYINLEGCNAYSSEYQYTPPLGVNVTEPLNTHFGTFFLPNCDHPQAKPVATTIVLLSYIVINGYMVRELCLATVAIGVDRRLSEIKFFSIYGDDVIDARFLPPKQNNDYTPDEIYERDFEFITKRLRIIWGFPSDEENPNGALSSSPKSILHGEYLWESIKYTHRKIKQTSFWIWLSQGCEYVSNHYIFAIVMCITIILDCLLVFIECLMSNESASSISMHLFFQILFTIYIIIQIIAHFPSFTEENMKKFLSNRKVMTDIALTILFFIPAAAPHTPNIRVLKYLRIVRLFRFLYIWGQYNVALSSAIGAFRTSYVAVFYIIIIIYILYLYFAIAGVLLFKDVNPYYFSTVSRTILTLLQVMTMDNWSDVMRKSILGCHYFGYNTGIESYDNTCISDSPGMGWWSPIYFVTFLVLNANVLVSFGIGVLISSIHLLRHSKDEEEDIVARVNCTFDRLELSYDLQKPLLELFDSFDNRKIANTVFDDFKPMTDILDIPIHDIMDIFFLVDLDKSGQVDFAEFCEFMTLLGRKYSDKKESIFKHRKYSLQDEQALIEDRKDDLEKQSSHRNSSLDNFIINKAASHRETSRKHPKKTLSYSDDVESQRVQRLASDSSSPEGHVKGASYRWSVRGGAPVSTSKIVPMNNNRSVRSMNGPDASGHENEAENQSKDQEVIEYDVIMDYLENDSLQKDKDSQTENTTNNNHKIKSVAFANES